ncbi:MAG: rod-binding protein [Bdellovibrionales bacterium]|nr:rod-binding protein [Bdellovibrionales bacterium]
MKASPAPPLKSPQLQQKQARQTYDDPRITKEMREAAQGLEAVFTGEMLKAMRSNVDESELSLKNSATEIYQGMLDSEYAEISAKQNSLGLGRQILDYWLRSMPQDKYNERRNSQVQEPVKTGSSRRTGGTHEGQSE